MPSGLTRAVLATMQRMGVTVLANWRVERYPMASCLRQLFGLLRVDCVLDVGANVGQYRNFLRYEVGFEGRILSFEPIPRNAELLRRRARGDRAWTVEPYALGAAEGEAGFNVATESVFSSFLKPNEASAALFKGGSAVTERITVPVHTLDAVLPGLMAQHGFSRPYLKLDTQGFDLEVVRGATESLPRCVGLQTEASVKPIYCDMPDYATTIRHLESLGFELTGMFPVNSGTFPRMVEFDCVMASTAFLEDATRRA